MALLLGGRQWFTGAKFTLSGKCVSSGCPSKSYYIPFQFCVLDSARNSGANKKDKVNFFAGLDRSFHEYASSVFNFLHSDVRLHKSLQELLGGICYPLARESPGIQAADLFTNRMYHHVLEKVAGNRDLPTPPLLKQLVKHAKPSQRFTLFNARILREIQEHGKKAYEDLVLQRMTEKYLGTLRET